MYGKVEEEDLHTPSGLVYSATEGPKDAVLLAKYSAAEPYFKPLKTKVSLRWTHSRSHIIYKRFQTTGDNYMVLII